MIGGAVEESAVVGSEAREEWDVMRPRQHVHGIDLDETEPVQNAGDVAPLHDLRMPSPKTLCGERDPASLSGA
jgi:hypothetical protein